MFDYACGIFSHSSGVTHVIGSVTRDSVIHSSELFGASWT